MERTVEELLAETSTVWTYPQLLEIIEKAESAQKAEDKAAELEFPTPLLRGVRLLWNAKRERPDMFVDMDVHGSRLPQMSVSDQESRVFPCSFRSKFSDDRYGNMVVKPNPALPPIFWDYKLLDEDGNVVYSPQGTGKEYRKYASPHAERTECVLMHGSRSLPASLRIFFEEESGGFKIEFSVSRKGSGYPADNEIFTWTRHIVLDRETQQKKEWYERTTSSLYYGSSHDRVVWREVTTDESEALHECGSGEWVLLLETQVGFPFDKQRHDKQAVFLLTTLYRAQGYVPGEGCNKDAQSFLLAKPERIASPFRTPGSAQFSESPFVLYIGVRDSRRYFCVHNSIEGVVYDISQHTPEHVDGLAALRFFFGFKYGSAGIYNTRKEEEMREYRKKYGLSSVPLPLCDLREKK